LFLDEGEPFRSLLEANLSFIQESGLLKYAKQLSGSFIRSIEKRPSSVPGTIQPDQRKLIEPLSDRELEVLDMMAEGLSNPVIAERLYLSTNTIRTHARNIYVKLEVHNRLEAVNKARKIGLLGSS
jgi:LuxR family maltose regulon positive regulatory protein